jgi:predicted Zn-dependent protease with MMP-like domain
MTANTQRDYYGILGIAPTATEDELRHAYRRLAKMWHPDRFRTAPATLRDQAERRMRLLTEAHAALADPLKRAEYDRSRHLNHATNGRDGVTPDAQPMAMPYAFHIPGYQPSFDVVATTSDPNGMGIFFGLILTILGLSILGIGMNNPTSAFSIVILVIGLAVVLVAVMSFAGAGPLVTIAQMGQRAEQHAAHPHANAPNHAAPEDASYFEDLVRQAVEDIPTEFAEKMENVAIFIEEEPSMAVLRRAGVKPGWTLLGLYEGVPLTKQGAFHAGTPERITLFQGPIERLCLFAPNRIEHQVRATLLHELAHHFGMDHDEMPIWVKA